MQEWYLIGNNTKPNMIGGYENEGFLDCKDDAFYETLETDLADIVILYNYDVPNTDLFKFLEKFENNTLNGMIIEIDKYFPEDLA